MQQTPVTPPKSGKLKLILKLVLVAAVAGSLATTTRYFYEQRRANRMETVYAFRTPSGGLFIEEDFQNPKLQEYRRAEHLDDVVKPYKSDLERILALAKWTSKQWAASSPLPNYPPWDGSVILDRIRRGVTGGFCAQYAFVFGQACQSFGYIVRYLDLSSPESPG